MQALDYRELFQGLPESYLLFEAQAPFTIVEVNKAREALLGVARQNSVGRPLFEVFPDVSTQFQQTGVNPVRDHIEHVVQTGKPQRFKAFRYDIVGANGKPRLRYWQSTYTPLRFGGKFVTHILATTKDVTDETRAEKQRLNIEERLEAALTIGKVGSWVWDMERDVVVGDQNFASLFGMDRRAVAQGLSGSKFLEPIHPEDRGRVEQAMARALKEHTKFDEEYRTVTATGKTRWVLARGKREEQGEKVLFPGVIVDITERRDLQAQVELAHRQDELYRQESKILQKRNEELETIGRTKDEFVALASHQLRTPATAVKQYLGMVLQGYVGGITELQTEMLQRAFESNERQIQIINQILNAARVDTGRLMMTMMPVDLCSLARGVADDMRSSLSQRKHEFVVNLPPAALVVSADLAYLRMAIENLLHNASIYTPEGGQKD
jgi:PAS domain S-box-containing protein